MTDRLERDLADVRRRWVPDPRLGVCEVVARRAPGAGSLAGCTTSRDALAALLRIAGAAGLAPDIRMLPDSSVRDEPAAVVRAAVAPLVREPQAAAERVSEALHGECLTVLERRDGFWLRVRTGDGYHAWLHAGYVATGAHEWADDWRGRAAARALGAELRLEHGRLRLPVGAAVVLRSTGEVEAADGCVGTVVAGVVLALAELRAQARLVAPPEWALRWFSGAPYAWGGRTEWGVDCSGLVQATYAARGITLARDSDLQSLAGRRVPVHPAGEGYQAGDLLCFTDGHRVAHVALWAGAGRIVHAALARGGVCSDDLFAETPAARRMREYLVSVRRVDG